MNTISNENEIYSSLGISTLQQSEAKESNQLQMEDFMNLLVTELTHQDPMKPMDNAELASQISQFSVVSGIDQLNTSFNSLSSTMTSDQALQASNLVGHGVMVSSNLGMLTQGGSLQGAVDLPTSASNVRVQISDASGALVRELNLGIHEAGELAFTWDGYNDSGDYMPAGLYQVSALATVDDVEMAPNMLVHAQVESVSMGGTDGIRLNLGGLGQVSMNNVTQIQ